MNCCHFFLIFSAIVLGGCYSHDPARYGEVPESPATKWTLPPCALKPIPCDDSSLKIDPNRILSASDMIDIALRNNPKTSNSWRIARAAAYNEWASESALFPSALFQETIAFTDQTFGNAGGGTASLSGASVGSAAAGTTGKSISISNYTQTQIPQLTLSYLLLDFGGRCASINAARQALIAADWTHDRVMQNVMINVLMSYYNYLAARAILTAREEDLKDTRTNLEAAQGLFDAGLGAKVDVLQAESNFVNAKLQVENQRGTVQTSMGQLANALGLPANVTFQVDPPPETIDTSSVVQDVDLLIATAKENRPDLASSYATYLADLENVKIIDSEGKPILTANGFAQRTTFIHDPAFNGHNYSGSLVLSVPLFNGFYYRNSVRSARETAKAQLAAYRDLESSIMLEVVTSYYAFKTAIESVKYSDEYLKYAQEAHDVAYGNYREGTGTILDLLVAQGALANARAQRIQARTQLVNSIASIAYTTGVL